MGPSRPAWGKGLFLRGTGRGARIGEVSISSSLDASGGVRIPIDLQLGPLFRLNAVLGFQASGRPCSAYRGRSMAAASAIWAAPSSPGRPAAPARRLPLLGQELSYCREQIVSAKWLGETTIGAKAPDRLQIIDLFTPHAS